MKRVQGNAADLAWEERGSRTAANPGYHTCVDAKFFPKALTVLSFDLSNTSKLILRKGDLTQARVDAIVNAANPLLLGGGGVDGALHQAAGPELLEACREVPTDDEGIRCPYGEARITRAGKLFAIWVLHAVGPRYRHEADPAALLESAYAHCFALARQHGVRTLAFPALSCGAYGYPLEEAAPIALRACRDHSEGTTEVHFYLFNKATYDAFEKAARELGLSAG